MTEGDRIRNLLGRYCDLMDAGDWPSVGALFARGRLADEHGTEIAAGAAAVERFYARGTLLHGGSPRTKHLVLNTVLDDPAGDGTIAARSSYLVLQAVPGAALRPIITGRYVDRFVPGGAGGAAGAGDPGWHFAERRFAVDLVGDLSQHLRSAP
ncbi:MAG TPA: nuclear transport factor 2 family protein [Acidimicrobiales bacterium]